jgi:hypothetical protein
MSRPWLHRLFDAVDAKDVPRFLEFLAEDASFRFGNLPACRGKREIGIAVQAFFDSIGACSHQVATSWEVRGFVICHGNVTYTRKDARKVTLPFANILAVHGNLIRDYLIFADVSPLFAQEVPLERMV